MTVALKIFEINRINPIDIIETPGLHGETSIFQFFNRRVPVIPRIHSCMPKNLEYNQIPNRLPLRVSHWHEKQAVALSHGLTAPSSAIIEDNRPYLPLKDRKVRVIPNPINPDDFPFREKKDQAHTDLTVLYVGRLDRRKGVHILSQAMLIVWKKHPEVQFLFVGGDGREPDGDGSMKAWIMNHVPESQRGQVSFIDHIPRQELPPLYQQSDMVVFPSLWEPFGYITLEAMATGTPLIATRSGGPQEIIEDGIDGFLVSVGSVIKIADKICEFIREPKLRKEMGNAARKKVITQYATPVVVKQMAAYYQSVLDRSH